MFPKKQRLEIRLKSYDVHLVDRTARDLVKIAKKSGSTVSGPIFLPLRIEKFTLNTSPHADKKAREQVEIRTSKRLIIINDPTPHLTEDWL
jgi:small subunit ribosomal protein S10